jgi:hypothetical protein
MSWNPADPSAGGATVVSEVRNMDIRELGFYVSDDFKVFDGLKLTAASRADHSTILPTKRYTFSPRLAAVADPASFWTSKLMFNKATRYPAPWATTLNGWQGLGNPYAPGWAAANPMANKPETMTAYEFQNIIRAGSHRISLNLYYQVLKDYITWAFPFTNVGDFKGTGAELDARGKIVTNLGYTLGASFNHNVLHPSGVNGPFWAPTSPAIATNDQGEMNGVARFSAVGGLDYSFTEAVSGSFTGRYLTHQSVEDYDRFLSPGGYGHYYNRFWLDAGLVWKAVKTKDGGVSVQLFGRNLLNNGARVAQQFNNGWINPRGRFLGLSLDYSWGKVQ